MVPWEVEFTNEFGAWWADDADQAIRNDLEAAVELLMEYGPALGRPVVDTIRDSRYLNMRSCGCRAWVGPYARFLPLTLAEWRSY